MFTATDSQVERIRPVYGLTIKSMQPDQLKKINQLMSYLLLIMTLRKLLKWCAVLFFVWGGIVLGLRFGLRWSEPSLALGLAGIFPIALGAFVTSWRQRPNSAILLAAMDRENQCGGLLMAEGYEHAGDWLQDLPPLDCPRITWKAQRALNILALAVLFLAITFFIPDRYVNLQAHQSLEIGHLLSDLQEQFEVLKEEEILEQEAFEEFKQDLTKLGKESIGANPARTWESLDHLKQSVSDTAKKAAQEALAKLQTLTQSETLAAALADLPVDTLDEIASNQAMLSLANLLQEARMEAGALQEKIPPELLEPWSGDLANLGELVENIRLAKENLGKFTGKLAACNLIDAEMLGQCHAAGVCPNLEGLIDFLSDNPSSFDSLGTLVKGYCRGGISRGRGDAPMTWTDGSSEEGARFKNGALTLGLNGLDQSQFIGVSRSAPEVTGDAATAESGALSNASHGGGSANAQKILPQHQGAVRRFFKRDP